MQCNEIAKELQYNAIERAKELQRNESDGESKV